MQSHLRSIEYRVSFAFRSSRVKQRTLFSWLDGLAGLAWNQEIGKLGLPEQVRWKQRKILVFFLTLLLWHVIYKPQPFPPSAKALASQERGQ
jgi:hypothetical protein